jgi:hypothetical protein
MARSRSVKRSLRQVAHSPENLFALALFFRSKRGRKLLKRLVRTPEGRDLVRAIKRQPGGKKLLKALFGKSKKSKEASKSRAAYLFGRTASKGDDD